MGLLDPRNLAWAAALAVLVAIYLRSRSRPTLEVSSLMLFDDVPAPVASVRQVHLDPLFWLEAAGLCALVFAAAGLYAMTAKAGMRGHSHALVFDVGAAMGGSSGAQGGAVRIDEAKRMALRILSAAPAGDEFSVLTYALAAHVAAPQTPNLAVVRGAIEALAPLDVPARASALRAVMMRARGASEIDFFTSREPDKSALRDAALDSRVNLHLIGGGDDNLGIVSLDAGAGGGSKGRIVLRNFTGAPELTGLAIDLDGAKVFDEPLMLAPREQVVVPFGPLAEGGLLHARLKHPDALLADNQRWALAPLASTVRVMVLSPDDSVRADLARVLLAISPNFQVETASPRYFHPDPKARIDLAVMHDCFVPGINSGATMLIYPPAKIASVANLTGFRIDGTADQSTMIPLAAPGTESDEGSVARVSLDSTRMMRMPAWMDTHRWALAGSADERVPLVASGEIPSGRIGVLAFDIRGHLLLDPDRLDALVATVGLVKRLTEPVGVRVVSTGDYVNFASTTPVKVTRPDRSVIMVRPDASNRVRIRPLEIGRYVVEIAGAKSQIFANYYDAAESDLASAAARTTSVSETFAVRSGTVAYAQRQMEPLGKVLIAIALLLFIVESIILVRHASRWSATHV